VTLGELLERAEQRFGEGACLDLSRDVVLCLSCPSCGSEAPGRAVLGALLEVDAACPACRTHRIVDVAASIRRDTKVDLAMTFAELGLPPFDIVVARKGLDQQAWLFDGDAGRVLGPLAVGFSAAEDAAHDKGVIA
jgi:hypothetical protein